MKEQKRTIDDVFEMTESRYALVNAVSRKAREIADEAAYDRQLLFNKPVNIVVDSLIEGRSKIVKVKDLDKNDLFIEDESQEPEEDLQPDETQEPSDESDE